MSSALSWFAIGYVLRSIVPDEWRWLPPTITCIAAVIIHTTNAIKAIRGRSQ